MIHHDGADMIYVETKGVSKKQYQKQGDGKGKIEAAEIPDQVIKFFASNSFYVFDGHGLLRDRGADRGTGDRPGLFSPCLRFDDYPSVPFPFSLGTFPQNQSR